MGNLLFIFSSKKINAKQQLADIQNEIDQIEQYKLSSFVMQKNFIALLYFSFLIIYPFGFGYIYFIFDRHDKIIMLCSISFIILMPILVYFLRKFIHFYFKWINESKTIKLVQLSKLKKQIISKVQETETFNDAKSILEKYDPNALRNLSMSLNNLSMIDQIDQTPARKSSHPRSHFPPPPPPPPSTQFRASPNRNYLENRNSLPPQPLAIRNPIYSGTTSHPNSQAPPQPISSGNFPSNQMPVSRTIKPILPQNRSVVEKLIDYVFNDGPSNRYALICSHCSSHNGMALPDEFDFISFICAYCNQFNPARKARPAAAAFDHDHPPQRAIEAPKHRSYSTTAATTAPVSNLNIFELSTELNKSSHEPHVEEPEDGSRSSTPKNNTSPSPAPSLPQQDEKREDNQTEKTTVFENDSNISNEERIRSISECSTASSTT